jgi:hypothetical protein
MKVGKTLDLTNSQTYFLYRSSLKIKNYTLRFSIHSKQIYKETLNLTSISRSLARTILVYSPKLSSIS